MIFHYQENPANRENPSVKRVDNDPLWQFHLKLMNKVEKGSGDFNPELVQIAYNCIITDILVSY